MKSALLIVNGIFTSGAIVSSAIKIAKETDCRLNATFLDADTKGVEGNYIFPNDLALTENRITGVSIREEDAKLIEMSIASFKKECESAQVQYSVNAHRALTDEELTKQASHADFMIVDSQAPFYKQLLASSMTLPFCPVLLLSAYTRAFDNIVLAYDYSPASMYAIKMFSYLMPDWKTKPVQLVHVLRNNENEATSQNEVNEYLATRFDHITVKLLNGNVEESLIEFIRPLASNSLVVLGSNSRTAVGRFFHGSLADAIVQGTQASVFVTHI